MLWRKPYLEECMASDWTTPPVVPTANSSRHTEWNRPADTPAVTFLPPGLTSQETQDTAPVSIAFSTRDLMVFLVLTVLFVPTITSVQLAGPAAFLYLVLAAFAFLLPSAFVMQWLLQRFPGHDAPYFRAISILGAKWSFLAAFCTWWPGVIAVIATIGVGVMSLQYLAPTLLTSSTTQFLVMMAVLLVATVMACLPLGWLKRILLLLVVPYYSFYVILGVAGGWWLWSGHPAAISLHGLTQLQPGSDNFAVYGLVLLGCFRIYTPLVIGIHSTKSARHFVWWGVALLFFAYIAGTFGVMVIVPPARSGTVTASLQAISMAFGSPAGSVAAIALACSQVTITTVFLLTFSRLLVIFLQDRQIATALTRVNRHGVPIRSTVTQAMVVASIAMLCFVAIPALFEGVLNTANLPLEICHVFSAGTTALWEFSAALLFFCVLKLFFHHKGRVQENRVHYSYRGQEILLASEFSQKPDTLSPRSDGYQGFLLPGLSIIGIGASLVGIWVTVWKSWIPTLIPDDHWIVIVGAVILVSLAIGWAGSEVSRVNGLLSEQRQANEREVTLRAQLQEAYDQQQVLLSEVDRLYREQARAATTDMITGLPNHRAVISKLDEELSHCQQTHSSCAVLFVDLDNFKQVNDSWGHRAGDVILRAVGSRLSSTLHPQDFVGRYGGEEFAVVLADTDVNGASRVAERLRAAVAAQPFYWENDDTYTIVPIEVTASIGVAVYQLHGVTREVLLEYADNAMYQAKYTGRNRVCIPGLESTPAEKMLPRNEQSMEFATVRALIAAASARDNGTNAHSQRMVQLAETTARMLNQPEEEIRLVCLGALLHDIGKIGIPDAILHKSGPLTHEEWDIMRRHPQIGHQILTQAGGVFEQLADIVVTHHEHWDGHGYPGELAQDSIPMSARILAVVDSYDAMISHRPYREPMSVTDARAELRRCAGSQFDPLVVETLLGVLDEQEHVGREMNEEARR